MTFMCSAQLSILLMIAYVLGTAFERLLINYSLLMQCITRNINYKVWRYINYYGIKY